MTSSTSPVPHGQQTFSLRSWRDLVDKLNFEIDEFDRTQETDPTPSFRAFRAINGAVTAWHIGDWFWEWLVLHRPDLVPHAAAHLEVDLRNVHVNDRKGMICALSKGMATKNRSLAICRTITNAFKHVRSEHFVDMLTTHPVHVTRRMSNSPNAEPEQFFALRVFAENQSLDMGDVLKKAAARWTALFRDCGLWSITEGWLVGE
ncbi:hypothetical protein [Stenotrophomonas bentonitica]|uniref:hypothetical protein n=1 Tax=Stenotrophomonas bentonitica TaxID=1450134 RepID=UPI00345F13E4